MPPWRRIGDTLGVRIALAVLLLLASTASHAGVLGLELGMTAAQVRAAKPCHLSAAAARATCKAVAFAGARLDVELDLPKSGLAKIALSTRLPASRKDAEPLADAILDKLAAEYGALEMTGAGELKGSAALFDNADRTYEQFRGKLAAGSMFHGDHAPSKATTHVGGKLVRDKKGYALEVAITK